MLGSIDANAGDTLLGWDTDQFNTDVKELTLAMVLDPARGRPRLRRLQFRRQAAPPSIDLEDLFHAHIGGMDAYALAFKIALKIRADSPSLTVADAVIQDTPFPDAHFRYVLADAWKAPYAGPSQPNIDNSTLKGKLMVGYQGWFRTPNDPTSEGWVHWGNMARKEFTTDMWPDTSAYPAAALDKAADVKTLSGKTGYLYSPAWPEIVQTPF
jgi:hypothetical protein